MELDDEWTERVDAIPGLRIAAVVDASPRTAASSDRVFAALVSTSRSSMAAWLPSIKRLSAGDGCSRR